MTRGWDSQGTYNLRGKCEVNTTDFNVHQNVVPIVGTQSTHRLQEVGRS